MSIDDNETTPQMEACSADIRKAVDGLMMAHDSRVLFACLGAETAYLGAVLRCAKIYKTETLIRVINEIMVTTLTREVTPKVFYTDSAGNDIGSKQ